MTHLNWYQIKKSLVLIGIIASALLPHMAYAKYLSEYFDSIEPLLLAGKYDEAKKKFDIAREKVREESGARVLSSNDTLALMSYMDVVKWLKSMDHVEQQLVEIEKNPAAISADEYDTLYQKDCDERECIHLSENAPYEKIPKSDVYFSGDFVKKLNQRAENLDKRFKSSYSLISKRQADETAKKEKEQQARIAKKNAEREALLAQQTKEAEQARLDEQKKEAEKKQQHIDENSQIDQWAKSHGYKGYSGRNIVNMIYLTQRDGGLENYVGQILGCSPSNMERLCNVWYPRVRISQVLDDALIYAFSEYVDNDYFDFLIVTGKESGKIYQENQSLSKNFYVFKGMVSFETTTGMTRTVPYFEMIDPQPTIE